MANVAPGDLAYVVGFTELRHLNGLLVKVVGVEAPFQGELMWGVEARTSVRVPRFVGEYRAGLIALPAGSRFSIGDCNLRRIGDPDAGSTRGDLLVRPEDSKSARQDALKRTLQRAQERQEAREKKTEA